MRLEHVELKEFTEEIKAAIGQHVDLNQYELFFFGSRVQDRGDDRSDIDIGIEGPAKIPSVTWANIEDAIENLPYLYKVDIVDFKNVGEDFYKIAKRTTEPIN